MNIKHAAATAVLGLATLSANSQTLLGADVSAALYCCVSPTEPYRVSTVESATVDNSAEFPVNSFTFLADGSTWDEGSIDIGESTLRLDLFASGVTNPGTFNGMVFSFSGAPVIVNASVNPGSTFVPTAVSFSSTTILVNVVSLPYSTGDYLLLDVALAPVPEAPAAALLGLGLLVLMRDCRARRQRRDA